MTEDMTRWGLEPGERPAGGFWPGVVDPQRSLLAKLGRLLGRIVLPGPIRNRVVRPDRTFLFAITDTDVLVVSGLTVTPLRVHPSDPVTFHDRGERRSMRTVIAGRLASVELVAPGLPAHRLLVNEDAVPYLASWVAA